MFDPIQFVGSAFDPGQLGLETETWDFGDGSPVVTVGQATIAHTFTTSATFNVTLVVRDDAGRTSVGTTVPVPIIP